MQISIFVYLSLHLQYINSKQDILLSIVQGNWIGKQLPNRHLSPLLLCRFLWVVDILFSYIIIQKFYTSSDSSIVRQACLVGTLAGWAYNQRGWDHIHCGRALSVNIPRGSWLYLVTADQVCGATGCRLVWVPNGHRAQVECQGASGSNQWVVVVVVASLLLIVAID